MANLDTREKRSSGSLPGLPYRGMLPLPDGTVDAVDRQAVLFLYQGISPTEAVVAEATPTIGAFTSTAVAAVLVQASATPTIAAFSSGGDTLASVLILGVSTSTIANFTSAATVSVGTILQATPTIADFISSATGTILVTATATPTIAAFTSFARIASAATAKYHVQCQGSNRFIRLQQ